MKNTKKNDRKKKNRKKKMTPLKVLSFLLLMCSGFFVITFTIYIFNLDMKLTSKIEPLLLKWYDRVPRYQHL